MTLTLAADDGGAREIKPVVSEEWLERCRERWERRPADLSRYVEAVER